MDIGRTAPRHQAVALLYRRAPDLQTYLCEYFIVVVDLCTHVMKFTQSSVFRKMATSLNSAELKTFRTELHRWSVMIQNEVNLRLASRVELEAQENAMFRIMSRKKLASITHERHLTTHLRILDRCSQFDYETTWKQLRKQGNTRIFSKSTSYASWRDSNQSNTFIYHGKLGCGKSIMMANLVEELILHVKDCDNNVAYFFCQYDLPEGLLARTIIASLTRQLLLPWSKFDHMVEIVGAEMNPARLLELLWKNLPDTHQNFFVIDGLHLCKASETDQVIHWIHHLQTQHHIKACISTRDELLSMSTSFGSLTGHLGSVQFPDNKADIEAYIDTELERCLRADLLPIGDPSILSDLRDALSTGAQGMFLWVALQIRVLCAMQTDRELKEATMNLPQGLTEIYERVLQSENDVAHSISPRYQERIFAFTTTAWRPLTLNEMREALNITVGDVTWDRSQLVTNIHSTLKCCRCLIVVDEEELTVRLVHPSVERYLLETYTGPEGIGFAKSRTHPIIADYMVTYLSYAAFQGELTPARIPEMNIGPAPSRIMTSALGTRSEATRLLALRFLKAGKNPSIDVRRSLAEALQSHRRTLDHEFDFHAYARKYGVLHLAHVLVPGLHVERLLPNLLNKGLLAIDERVDGFEILTALAQANNLTVFQLLFIKRQQGVIVRSERLDDAIRDSLVRDDPACLPLLVKSKYITYDHKLELQPGRTSPFFDTALSHAVRYNSVRVAEALLPISNMTDTMFTDAIKKGYGSMAKLLFENRPNPAFFNINFNALRSRPLSLAIAKNRPQIVEMLLMSKMVRLTPVEEATIKSQVKSAFVKQLLDAADATYGLVKHEQSLISGIYIPADYIHRAQYGWPEGTFGRVVPRDSLEGFYDSEDSRDSSDSAASGVHLEVPKRRRMRSKATMRDWN